MFIKKVLHLYPDSKIYFMEKQHSISRRHFFAWLLCLVSVRAKAAAQSTEAEPRIVVIDNWFLLESDLEKVNALPGRPKKSFKSLTHSLRS